MLKLTFIVLLSLCLNYVCGQETVYVDQGVEVRGTTMTSRNGRTISAYLGIPYAKPPVGPLRFSDTQPVEYESGQVITADTDGNECPQLNDDDEVVGDEDCLILNVYTTNTNPDDLMPTMVYFHGGGWLTRSSSSTEAGPEYLLDRDVVLVTVNYRLGVLGFLNVGDNQASGNFGLKDQVVALQWVQRYISAFGGDPNLVTIFGQGAGGASTSFHAVSPASDGLFHRFISQSGNLVAWWALHVTLYDKTYAARANKLGDYMNCPTSSTTALVDCLRDAETSSLVKGSIEIIRVNDWWYVDPWSVTVENEDSPNPFLNFDPVSSFMTSTVPVMKDIPGLIGTVADEGLFLTAELYSNSTAYDKMANNVLDFLTFMQRISFDDNNPEVSAEYAMSGYLNNDLSNKSAVIRGLTDYVTDVTFVYPMKSEIIYVLEQPRTQPLYVYLFDYRGEFSRTSLKTGNNENYGVTTGDDLIYIFPAKNLHDGNSEFEISDSDGKMIDIMIDMWTNFAATGIPIANSTTDPLIWKPYDSTIKNNLKIGDGNKPVLSTQYEYRELFVAFWSKLAVEQFGFNFIDAATNG